MSRIFAKKYITVNPNWIQVLITSRTTKTQWLINLLFPYLSTKLTNLLLLNSLRNQELAQFKISSDAVKKILRKLQSLVSLVLLKE